MGTIKTLFSDINKTEALFPRTKVSAISDDNGTGLNVLLNNKADKGFGIGIRAIDQTPITDFNDAIYTGWYSFNYNTANHPSTTGSGIVRVESYRDGSSSMIIQTAYVYGMSSLYIGHLIRTSHNDVWGDWEWENPPMITGVEFRTTERWDGRPVYKRALMYKLTSATSGSGITDITIPTGIINLSEIVSYKANISHTFLLPYLAQNGGNVAPIKLQDGNLTIRFRDSSFGANETIYLELAYTKTTN